MSGSPVIRCTGLTKRYGPVAALQSVDLALDQGRILALVGPSGCGKTTTLRMIAGFETPDSGIVTLAGQVVAGPGVHVPPEKRRIGLVSQEYALFPHLTVGGNVAYGLPRDGDRMERVREVLALVDLEGLEGRYPHQLSGGQQQRVALARTLAPRPVVVLLDEPFSNLDPDLRARVRAEFKEILRRAGATAILVTHDRQEAINLGDLVAVMRQGRVEQVDTPERVYHRPATRFVAGFIGPATFLPAVASEDRLATEIGELPQHTGLPGGTPVHVMVRPDDITIRPDRGGRGTIEARELRGGYFRYTVRLPSGATVESQLPHVHDYPTGARVSVALDPGHPLPCFQDGRPIPLQEGGPHGHPPPAPARAP